MTFKEAFKPGMKISITIVAAAFLGGLAILGGYILLIIPGLIFSAWFQFSQYAIAEEKLGVIAGLKRSKELVKGRIWEIFGLTAMLTIFGLIRIIPIIGSLIAGIVSIILMPIFAVKYFQLKQLKESKAEVPVDPINYVLVVIAIVAFIISLVVGLAGFKNNLKSLPSSPTTTAPTSFK